MSSTDVIPMLNYENGVAALEWLAKAFGFQEVARMCDPEGMLQHGEMLVGNARIMLATTPHYESPRRHQEHCAAAKRWLANPWIIDGVLVYVDDIDAHIVRARSAGATILTEIEDGFPGEPGTRFPKRFVVPSSTRIGMHIHDILIRYRSAAASGSR